MRRSAGRSARSRAVMVVCASILSVAVVGTGAFGATHPKPTKAKATAAGSRFAAAPNQARYGHVPNTLRARSVSTCPTTAHSVVVKLMQGTTTLASASTTPDAKGKWSLTLSIPTDLKPGTYAVTAACYASATPGPSDPSLKSYKPQNFRVVPRTCPSGTTTSTTVKCRPPLPPSTSTSSIP